jgi:hypothetical protein
MSPVDSAVDRFLALMSEEVMMFCSSVSCSPFAYASPWMALVMPGRRPCAGWQTRNSWISVFSGQ